MGKITLLRKAHILFIFLLGSSLLQAAMKSNISSPVITGVITELVCNNDSNASITISVTGGTAPYTYLWNNSSTSKNRTNLSAGTYTLQVTDASSQTTTKSFVIDQPAEIIMNSPNGTNISCFNGNDGKIIAGSVSGGSGSFEYAIDGSSFQSSNTFSDLESGYYVISVRDSKGCTKTKNITLSEPSELILNNSNATNVSCKGSNDGTVTVGSISGGTGGYTYSINGSSFQTSNNFSGLLAGNYTITVKDSKACTTSENITVSEPSALTLQTSGSKDVSCFSAGDGSITVGNVSGGNGGYTYSINGTNFQTSNKFLNLSGGNYTLTVKDSKDCTTTENIEVKEPSALSMQPATLNPVSCFGGADGSITAGAVTGGNNGYQYSINGTNFLSSKNFNNLKAGNYTITAKDTKGCTITELVNIEEPYSLTMQPAKVTPVTCSGASNGIIEVGAVTGGNNGYEYSINGTTFQNGKIFSGLSNGSYTITARDAKACTVTEIVTITQPNVLTITSSTSTPVTCNGDDDGSITAGTVAGGNGGPKYSIDGTNFQSSNTFPGLSGGTYILNVKDSKGCIATENVTVTEPPVLAMTTSSSSPTSCNGALDGTITSGNISGGNNGYQFSIDGTNFQSDNSFAGLAAGNYTLSVRDSKNCIVSEVVTVSEPDKLSMQAAVLTSVSCFDAANGSISAGTVTGGNSGYEFSIDGTNYKTSNKFDDLSAGLYTITARDSKGCTISEDVEIIQPEVLNMQAATVEVVGCAGEANGTITAGAVSGGNGNYEYSIDGTTFKSNNTFTGLSGGNYILSVRDSKGCSISENIELAEPATLTMAPAEVENVKCFDSGDGEILAGVVSGGNGAYEYSLDGINFSPNNLFTSLNVGSYTITVRDSKGCSATEDITITGPQILEMDPAIKTDISCHGASNATVTAGEVRGGTTGYQYSIDGVNFGSETTFYVLYAGTYTLTVRDLNGCQIEEVIEITEPQPLTSTPATSTPASCSGNNDGTIVAGIVTGGNGGYLYSIDNTNFKATGVFTNVPEGSYTVFIKDSLGCATQSDVIVGVPESLNAAITVTNVKCFNGSDGSITLNNPTGGHGAFEYSLDDNTWQTNPKFVSLSEGIYTVKIRDRDFPTCEVTLSTTTTVSQPTAAVSVQVTTTRTTTYGTSTGSATANATGGTPGYTYAWRKLNETTVLQTTKTANGLAAGNYEVTVTDKNGCSKTELFTIIDAINASILSRSTCEVEDNIDTIRTFHFIVENETAYGGIAPYTYSWNFGVDALNPNRSGIGEFWVDYTSTGNKTITLTVTDSAGEKFITTQDQFVGKCYNPCGRSSNIEFDPNNIFIGNSNGEKIEISNPDYCNPDIQKFIYIKVDKSANIYNPYIEIGYSISNSISETNQQYFENGCRSGDDIDEDQTVNQPFRVGGFIKLTIKPLNFNCGDNLNIDTFYTTWTNVSKKLCGQNNNKFCYSTNQSVLVLTELKAQATPVHILCKGESTGFIIAKASGGYAPYNYNITGANSAYSSSNQFLNLPAGSYTVYVEDSAGNRTTANATVLEPNTNIIANTTVINPTCFGGTGEVSVEATGGTPFTEGAPYKYLWNDSLEQTTATATNLESGDYTVTVIDANGCQAIKTISIVEPAQITQATAGEDQNFSCGFNSTNLNGNVPEEGTGTWTIISGAGGQILEPNNPQSFFTGTAQSYTLRWTISNIANTCTTSDEVSISFTSDCSTLDFDGVDDHISIGDNYNLNTGNFTIEAWVKLNSTNGQRTIVSKRDSQNLSAGGYDLSINSGSPTFKWGNSTVTSSYKLTTQRWYHVAVIFTASQAKLYVDGIKVGNGSASNPTATNSPFLIGAIYRGNKPENPVNYFHGWIEEVRIWKTALQEEQIRFMMNQRLKVDVTPVRGTVLPLDVPGALDYANLLGYYQLIGSELTNGYTPDKAGNKVDGQLKNIETTQENSAPLPYISKVNGKWRDKTTWARPDVWDAPNSLGINGEPINWNIAQISHDINSGGKDIYLLGLLSQYGELTMANPNETLNENNSGQGITVTHYLDLNGSIDLIGESQLVQTEGSILAPTSAGFIERDQQGTASSYNYNYWSSPVIEQGTSNSNYVISEIMLDGTDTNSPKKILFGDGVTFADGQYSNPRKISNYWLWKFRGTADEYSEWKHIGGNGTLKVGEGYTMKGTSGDAAISDRQNYTYKGKPNNGTFTLTIGKDQNYLIGNPYPSAIDAKKFILDNIKESGGLNSKNVFTGAIYYWDHFAGKTHILREYIGGYATYNLIGGVKAIAMDDRINSNTNAVASKTPGQYIPVGQGFFINSMPDPAMTGDMVVEGGDVIFKNSQRTFMRESVSSSQFLMPETVTKSQKQAEAHGKIRVKFRSPKGYHRELLVGINPNATNGFDLGYDAPLNEYNVEDMFWMIKDHEFVIQGVSNFDDDQILPIGVAIEQEGIVSIGLESMENLPEDKNVYLHDILNDTIHDIKTEPYKTSMKPGYIVDRFALIFYKEAPIEVVDTLKILEEENLLSVRHGYRDNEIQILNSKEIMISQLDLYNLEGRLLEKHTDIKNSKEVRIGIKNYKAGVYIVKLQTEYNMITTKIMIKN